MKIQFKCFDSPSPNVHSLILSCNQLWRPHNCPAGLTHSFQLDESPWRMWAGIQLRSKMQSANKILCRCKLGPSRRINSARIYWVVQFPPPFDKLLLQRHPGPLHFMPEQRVEAFADHRPSNAGCDSRQGRRQVHSKWLFFFTQAACSLGWSVL